MYIETHKPHFKLIFRSNIKHTHMHYVYDLKGKRSSGRKKENEKYA